MFNLFISVANYSFLFAWSSLTSQLRGGTFDALDRCFICTIILLKSFGVSKLQIAILARSSREMSQTVRIDWKHILSRVRVSVRPSNFYTRKTPKLSRIPSLPHEWLFEWSSDRPLFAGHGRSNASDIEHERRQQWLRAWSIWIYRLCRKKNTLCQSDRFASSYSRRPSTVFREGRWKMVEVCVELTFQNDSQNKRSSDMHRQML